MRPGRHWNECATLGKPNMYPPLDSLSVSQDLEPRRELAAERGPNYKPLVALNIDIGEPTPVKIFVYDFTDPWKRAYEFLQAYDLPEEMHEDIALLIANAKEAKEKELKMQRLAMEKEKAMNQSRTYKCQSSVTEGRRRTSCELRPSNSSSRLGLNEGSRKTPKEIFGNVQGPHNPFRRQGLERNMSTDLFSKPQALQTAGSRMLAKHLELETRKGMKETGEKSNILDSTTLLSSTTDKQRPSMNDESPFESNVCDLTDLEYSTMRPSHVTGKRLTLECEETQGESLLEPSGAERFTADRKGSERDIQEDLVKKLFNRLDYEGGGIVRSYDVYLSDLPSETKNTLQAILSYHDDRDSFKSFDFASFRAALLSSADFSTNKLLN